jgi:putative ABC transport system permease protein
MQPRNLPRLETVGIDGTVLLFATGASILAALAFGAIPALKSAQPNLVGSLKDRGSDSGGIRGNRLRTALVVAEVALSLVLLLGAGLMVRSFANLKRVEPGFDPRNVLTLSVPLPLFKYRTEEARVSFFERLQQRVAALPGVDSVGGATPIPLGGGDQYWVQPYGREDTTEEEWNSNRADYRAVLPGYLRAMGMQILAGRPLIDADNQPGALPVVVLDEKLATQTWPDGDPIGKAMQIVRFNVREMKLERAPVQVVGIVEHVRAESLTEEGRGAIYYPYRFFPWWPMTLTVRGATNPSALVGAIRAEVAALDPDVPVADVRPMDEYVADAMAPTRFTLTLLAVFAGLALVLAAVGLYGVISYSLRQRIHEIGVRLAFGAGARSIVGLIVRHGVALSLAGVFLGVSVAIVAARMASSLLFGVTPTDPATFVGISLLLVAVTALASYIPARRAAKIDPVRALRLGSR